VKKRCTALVILAASLALTGCVHNQSVLAPGGPEAENWFVLTLVLVIGATVIFAAVMFFVAVAMRGPARLRALLAGERSIIGGGLIFPTVTLSALLIYGMVLTAGQAHNADSEPLRITVIGEQWWWRIIYEGPNRFETANELKIPAGRTVRLTLKTADVIHSFWVPNLAGKLDMIPGRETVLTLDADEPGTWRGQCAEYCGGAHALMSFQVEALTQEDFSEWLEQEGGDAVQPTANEQQGQALFQEKGCGGCHAVRGTRANGRIGPDLTHFGSRATLAAAILPNTVDDTANWIRHNQTLKPQNLMLPYDNLSDEEARAIAQYLAGLK